jgi:hypothetical protein
MIRKSGNIAEATLASLFVAALYIGRYLGLVGTLGLLLRLTGWYKAWIWVWVVFVIIGFVSAAILEKLQKKSHAKLM